VLLREEYIAAFTHEDRVVRNTALELVTRCKAGGMDASRQALRTIEAHGFDGGFLYLHNLLELPLDDETSGQLLGLLSSEHHRGSSHQAFNWLITMAPVGFLEIHREAIRGLEKDYESFFPDDFIGKRIEDRLRLAATPPSELLLRLDALPMECSVPRPSYPVDLVNEASKIIDTLADIPAFRGELESRANSWIALEVAGDAPDIAEGEAPVLDNFWHVIFAVSIVGKLRLQHTVPTLVKLLSLDNDSMNEHVADALVEMSSIHTLQSLEEAYPKLEWHERLFLGGTCSHISEPGVDAFLQRLLDSEDDPELFIRLMACLSMQPTKRATETCAEFYRDYQDDPEAQEIAENLYTRYIVLDQPHADLKIWQKVSCDIYERFLKAKSSVSDFSFPEPDDTDEESLDEESLDDAPLPWNSPAPSSKIAEPFIAPPKTSRNDPCPCGSGKKFKKCCFTA
jgi:hypothetical protein